MKAPKFIWVTSLCVALGMGIVSCGDENEETLDKNVAGTEVVHEYVDLGLSVKWATCNVGASSPEEYGDYYAWGETEPDAFYDWSTYQWGSSSSVIKYCTSSKFGPVDNKQALEPSDDVAQVKWGSNWRTPTRDEQDELRDKCTWTWTTLNGTNGYKVTSKKNGNSIFLPAAGYRFGSSLGCAGTHGYYWSNTICTTHPDIAYSIRVYKSYVDWDYNNRYIGYSVRPVLP